MKIKNIFSAILMAMLVVSAPMALTSCDGEDQLDTNQFSESLSLLSFGPSPVARGGELRFIGTGLNNIQSISIPGCDEITEINRKSNREISIIVPKTAQPGYVTLHSAKKDLETKTRLSFTEPVGFAESQSISPNPVKPGQTLTIKGSYLNLVQSVIFADDAEVTKLEKSSADEPMEMTLKVVVPAEAKSGKIFLGFYATGDTVMNKVLSDEILQVVLPSVAKIKDIEGSKPGDKITIEGKDLDLVAKVLMPNNKEVEFSKTETSISFTLPEDISAGFIKVVTASNVEVTVANNGVAQPKNLVATPDSAIHAGDIITISGENLDIVTFVTFPGVSDTILAEKGATATEMKVVAPKKFQSGDMKLHTGYGMEFSVAIKSAKPVITGYSVSPAPAGSEITVQGTDLNLVSAILFKGADSIKVENATATEFKVTVPLAAESGDVILSMTNGEITVAGTIEIDKPKACFIPEGLPKNIEAGTIIKVVVANEDKLTGVEVNGKAAQYILNGTDLLVNIPSNAALDCNLKLISSNGELDYPFYIKPTGIVETVIWEGAVHINWGMADADVTETNAKAVSALSWGGYDWASVGNDYKLKVYFIMDEGAGWGCIRLGNGSWAALPGHPSSGQFDFGQNDGVLEFDLTPDALKALTDQGGLVITGANVTIYKVTLAYDYSAPVSIWTGNVHIDWSMADADQTDTMAKSVSALAYGNFDWSSVEVGTKLYVDFVMDEGAGWGCIRLGNGSWVALPGHPDSGQIDFGQTDSQLVFELTQAALSELVNNNGLVITGANLTITKVALK